MLSLFRLNDFWWRRPCFEFFVEALSEFKNVEQLELRRLSFSLREFALVLIQTLPLLKTCFVKIFSLSVFRRSARSSVGFFELNCSIRTVLVVIANRIRGFATTACASTGWIGLKGGRCGRSTSISVARRDGLHCWWTAWNGLYLKLVLSAHLFDLFSLVSFRPLHLKSVKLSLSFKFNQVERLHDLSSLLFPNEFVELFQALFRLSKHLNLLLQALVFQFLALSVLERRNCTIVDYSDTAEFY